jgi:hypothetical protein
MRCESRLHCIVEAVLKYANEHEGRMPEAKNSDELKKEILPYLRETSPYGVDDVWFCPEQESFLKNPEPFVWNPALSGKTFEEMAEMDPRSIALRCPCLAHDYGEPGFFPSLAFLSLDDQRKDRFLSRDNVYIDPYLQTREDVREWRKETLSRMKSWRKP